MLTLAQLTTETPATEEDANRLTLRIADELEDDALAQLARWQYPDDIIAAVQQLRDARQLRVDAWLALFYSNGNGPH